MVTSVGEKPADGEVSTNESNRAEVERETTSVNSEADEEKKVCDKPSDVQSSVNCEADEETKVGEKPAAESNSVNSEADEETKAGENPANDSSSVNS
ncbi:hypothetical protein PsorP6_011042 [Peronosclerospora sorghi]|uniref:Uncharacterized protein n=1 Tax=Peronosclerospora sorghi TaxID=230839 RepID=A0ACC0VU56_9STRA|nr:hypothetical protein PsorP6_011042 [Peronosclerospora sorghi]